MSSQNFCDDWLDHDWVEDYYGQTCRLCGMFIAFGQEPWALDDISLHQHRDENGDGG